MVSWEDLCPHSCSSIHPSADLQLERLESSLMSPPGGFQITCFPGGPLVQPTGGGVGMG